MISVSLVVVAIGASQVAAQSYSLQDSYSGSNFFSNFDFLTGPDPTNGFVNYLSYNDALSQRLIPSSGTPSWGVDNTSVISTSSSGRASVRLSSKASYNHGLFIADIAHMPDSTCGLWPAYWLLGGGTWPAQGEIDIIEGVNNAQTNTISGHTTDGCTITNTGSGTLNAATCSSTGSSNTGCGVSDSSTTSYGTGFNNAGGGVYAVEWTSQGFSVWHFRRSTIPSSIQSGSPDPQKDFGSPIATFAGSGCNIDSHFQNMQIVIDTTFCGDWAGQVYSQSPFNCPSSCTDYVANNPSAFDNAYWSFNSINVYQAGSYVAQPETDTSTVVVVSTTTAATSSATSAATMTATTFVVATSSTSAAAQAPPSTPAAAQATSSYSETPVPVIVPVSTSVAAEGEPTTTVVAGNPWSGHHHRHTHTGNARRARHTAV